MKRALDIAAAVVLAALLLGPPARGGDGPIQDNSFLVEEAYNQEAGVVQHILNSALDDDGGGWIATFTQEWPLAGQRHQLSYALPYGQTEIGSGAATGIGDVFLNYRYQLVGDGTTRLALSPRGSLILPTGDETEDLGAGAWGLQVNIPFSAQVLPRLVSHTNLGATWIPNARNATRDEADTFGWFAGQSFVWLAAARFNVLLETTWAQDRVVIGPGLTDREERLVFAPGVRFAIDLRSGLQIVPGIAATFGARDADGEDGVFVYLSFEHAFAR